MGIQINGQTDTVTATDGSINVGGDVTIPGVLTYDDVTNIDSVGLITARTGLRVTAGGIVVTAGVSTFSGDVSIADKIIHTGDTNTAFRFPAADTVTIETGGKEALRVGSDQKVYFGDFASAGSKAYIEKEVSGDYKLNIHASSSTAQNRIITFNSREDVEAMRLDASGNLGIGTDDPQTKLELFTNDDTDVNNDGGTNNQNSILRLYNKNGTDDTGVDNYVGIRFDVSNGARSSAYLNYVRTGNNQGAFLFKARNAASSYPELMRITSAGNVGIGSEIPNAKLEVRDGKIRAGTDQSTNGMTILEGRYSNAGDILNILGSHHSNGATVLSYGMRPKTGSSGYVSSFANFSGGRAALEMWGEGAQIVTAPSQNTAIGSDLTNVAGAVMVNNNGDVTMRGTDSQYIEMASFRTTNGATLTSNNGGYLSFTAIQNTNSSVIVHSTDTNPTRITFPVAGVVHLNYHQDIRSGNASTSSHYDHIKVRVNGNAITNALITSTNALWDNIAGTITREVAANDYIELELATNTSIEAWDNSGWSSYNFIFAPINTNL